MKNIFIIIFATLLVSTSCKKDPLDITPDGRMTIPDVFLTQDNTEAYLNSCYEYVRKFGTGYHYYTFLTAYSDDANDSQTAESWFHLNYRWYPDAYTSSDMPFMGGSTIQMRDDRDIYARDWAGIRKTNVFLANVNEKNIPEAWRRNQLIAEAKVLRAFYYLDMLKMFGPIPIIEKDMTKEIDFSTVKRPTFDECTRFVVKDCDEAIAEPDFPIRQVSENDRGRMTKAVALTIKSYVTLFNASTLWNPANDPSKWQAAVTASKQALTTLTGSDFGLYPNYERLFITRPDKSTSPADKETIFEATDSWGFSGQSYRRIGQIAFLMHFLPISGFGGEKSGTAPTQEMVDAYEMKDGTIPILGYSDEAHLQPIINPASGYNDAKPYLNRDPRFYASIWYDGAYFGKVNSVDYYVETFVGGKVGISTVKQRTNTGYYLRKYIDPAMRPNNYSTTLYRIFRLGEIYLNVAEAENEANGPTQVAYDAVNAIRRRAGMPDFPAGLSKDQFRERLRRERRVETAFEENRFYDSRRWGADYYVSVSKVKTGMRWVKAADGTMTNTRFSVVPENKAAIPKYLLMPIPLGETIRMPGMTQNPGW